MSYYIPYFSYKVLHESRYTKRRAGVAGVLLLTALSGKLVDNAYSAFKANQAQPACEITAKPGDKVESIQHKLSKAGDSGDDVIVIAHQDGHVRNPNEDARFFINDSMALDVNDTVRFEHVKPAVCQAVGGMVLGQAAKQASAK